MKIEKNKRKFTLECDECDGLVLIDESNLDKLNQELLYELDILLDFFGKTELIYDFPDEKWETVRERETKRFRDLCNSGEMVIWLLDCMETEFEVQIIREIPEPYKWLNVPSGKLIAVTAGELIQFISYPELEMEKIFEIDVKPGWYAVSKGSIEKVELANKKPPEPPFDNIQDISSKSSS